MLFKSEIHSRSCRNHVFTQEQRSHNREKLKFRAWVEHVFGHWVLMGGKLIRGVGQVRIAKVGLLNLSYNLRQYVYLQKQSGIELLAGMVYQMRKKRAIRGKKEER